VIATATGVRPLVAGKPEPPLHRESVMRTGAKNPLVVGDRLDTDIESAHRVGSDSLLVLTGVTSPAEAVLAPPPQRPTYLAEDLTGLLEPHPVVTSQDGAFGCGGWTARRDRDRLELAGRGDRIDGLRALCGAAWAEGGLTGEAEGGLTGESVRSALRRLGPLNQCGTLLVVRAVADLFGPDWFILGRKSRRLDDAR
jgi:glycerol-1-phosphatase